MPLAPLVTVIHVTSLTAVHEQPFIVRTSMLFSSPLLETRMLSGRTEKVHPDSWLTLTVRPATDTVPLRAGPVFTSTATRTVPVPVPAAGCTESQGRALDAVQVHAGPVVTWTSKRAPGTGETSASGETANVQAAAWVMVTGLPAIVSTPVRGGPGFGATEKVTEPVPVPAEPDVIVIQDSPVAAVHVQPGVAVTATAAFPPAAATACRSGLKVYEQAGGGTGGTGAGAGGSGTGGGIGDAPAACVTVTRCPAMTTEPVRPGPSVAATSRVTAPLPFPEGDRTLIQSLSEAAVHVHSALDAWMPTVADPPRG